MFVISSLCLAGANQTLYSSESLLSNVSSVIHTYPKTAIALTTVAAAAGALKFFNQPLKLEGTIENATDQQILKDFYVMTYAPTQDKIQVSDKLSLDYICNAIESGNKQKLNNHYADTTEKIFDEQAQMSIKKPNAPERATKIIDGIPSGVMGTIVIYVSGFSGQHSHAPKLYPVNSVHTVHRMYEKGMLDNVHTISYSGPHQDRLTFNYGQELDQICLDRVYKLTVQRNPNAKVVLFGISAGATIILNYLANEKYGNVENVGNVTVFNYMHRPSRFAHEDPVRFPHLDSVILESPAISFDDVIASLKTSDYKWGKIPHRWTLPWLFYHYFPNYKPGKTNDEILATYKNIPTHIKIFLGNLEHDQVANRFSTAQIYCDLNTDGRQVINYEYKGKEAQHGRLGGHPEYQKAVKNFLKKYGLDHLG